MFQVTKNHGDEEIVQVQDWLEGNYNQAITLERMTQSMQSWKENPGKAL